MRKLIQVLQTTAGANIIAFGGASFAAELLRHDCGITVTQFKPIDATT